ncbi:hypothetical protein [Nocardia sp. NPDC051832]|uniref:hypothetical protein n=1 Tax=Nocardia sp. NPDC051832 TaxID=3155673 RepID=UPI00343FA9E7
MATTQRTKFHAPVGFLKEAKHELGYTTQQAMLLDLVQRDLKLVRKDPPDPDSRRWDASLPIQYPDWYYLPGDWKETTVSAPEGFLEAARRELGYPDEEEMLLDLTRDALLEHRQRESLLRVRCRCGTVGSSS